MLTFKCLQLTCVKMGNLQKALKCAFDAYVLAKPAPCNDAKKHHIRLKGPVCKDLGGSNGRNGI